MQLSVRSRASFSLPLASWGNQGSPHSVSVSWTQNQGVRPEDDRSVLQGLQVSPVRSFVPLIFSAHTDNRIVNCVFWVSPPFMFSVLEGERRRKREKGRERQLVLIFKIPKKKKKNQSHWSVWKTKGPNPFHYPPLWLKLKCSLKKKKKVISDCKEENLSLSLSLSVFLGLPHLLCLFPSLLRET